MTRKWIKVNNLLANQYSVNKNVRFKTLMLRSDLYDYSDAYIVVGLISFKADIEKKDHVLKNNAPFVSCIKNSTNTLIVNAEDLNLVRI